MGEFSWVLLLGGLTFFFFGLAYARNGLQLIAGDRLRLAIAHLTNNRFSALGLGVLITVVLQSSTATLLMLISLARTGLLTLPQAFGVILGADIGTTLVVILLTIKRIADVALCFVVVGFLLEWIAKESKRIHYFGKILFGFGLLFYGMKLMTATAGPLASNPDAKIIFSLLLHHPIALLIASTILTVLIQTSAATIGMAIALALAGIITLPAAIPIVLGANVGTCFSAIMASLGGNVDGKRVALAHLFVKVAGVLLAMPFIRQIVFVIEKFSSLLTRWIPFIEPGQAGNIAIVHLLFNVFLAILFIPFLRGGVWLISKLVFEKRKRAVFGPKYLDKNALTTPPLAFAQAKQEILRLVHLTMDLYQDCLKMFDRKMVTGKIIPEVEVRDDQIDLLDKEIRFYLAKISQESLTEGQVAQQMALLSIAADLEGIGDIISKELTSLARKMSSTSRLFSAQGWEDLNKLHARGTQNFSLTLAAITSPNQELARKVIREGQAFNELEQKLRHSHIQRLHEGKPESFETSSIHLDVLGNLRRINGSLMHLSQQTLQI